MSDSRKKIQSLRFENITFNFDGHESILNKTDFEFPMQQIIWVKSPEGAGKSTLLQILAGLEVPQVGKYIINQDNVSEMSFEEFLPYRLNIGYSFDYGGLISNKSIYENLIFPLLYHKMVTPSEAKERVNGLLAKFGLTDLQKERPAHVPGRVRKLACILRALAMQPQMLLMDDPSVGLGQETSHLIVDHLNELREQGFCQHLFISSYDEAFMSLMNYQLVHLDGGNLYMENVDPTKKVMHL